MNFVDVVTNFQQIQIFHFTDYIFNALRLFSQGFTKAIV